MEIIILDKDLNKLALIEDADVIWTTRFYDVGDFEIYVAASTQKINLLQIGFYVMRTDDDQIGVIEDLQIEYEEQSGEFLKATGRFVECLLERRIVWEQTRLSGTAENGLRNLINTNIINPTDSKRKIPKIELGNVQGFTERLDAQYTGDNLLEINKNVALQNNTGFKFKLENGAFKFELYKGKDRSYNQNANTYVVFSDEYDNLISSEYQHVTSLKRNCIVVAGEGEGAARRRAVIGVNEEGLDRYELFVDAKDISSNSGEIDASEYEAALIAKGNESIVTITQAFTGQVDLERSYKYKRDFFVGDIVTIENKNWGIFINSRIIEIIESFDNSGYKITPTFGA